MSPSTRATRSEAATSADLVTFREVATTLNPRSTNAFTTPAPMPCDAPVTMAVFRWLLMVVYLEPGSWSRSGGSEVRPYFFPLDTECRFRHRFRRLSQYGTPP